MMINSPLSLALINPPALLLSNYQRCSLLLLCLKLPFSGPGNCFAKNWEGQALIPGWSTWLKPALFK